MNDLQRAQLCADKMYANDRASKALGIEIEIPDAGSAIATMHVRETMVNGFDICHGGLVFTLADTAFAFACNAYDELTVAGSGSIEFLRPSVRGDQLRAVATEEHRGRKSGKPPDGKRSHGRDFYTRFRTSQQARTHGQL